MLNEPPLSVSSMTRGQLARRRRLTSAVVELLGESTPDQLQMKQVADHSLVSLGAMYRYFSCKDHLLAAALTDWHAGFAEHAIETMEAPAADGSREVSFERVWKFVLAQIRGFERYPNFARLMTVIYVSSDPYASQEIERVVERNQAMMVSILPGLGDDVAHPASRAIASTLTLQVMHWQGGRLSMDELINEVEQVVRFILGRTVSPGSWTLPGDDAERLLGATGSQQ